MTGMHMTHVVRDLRMVGAVMVCMLVTLSQQSAPDEQDGLHTSSLPHTNNRHRRTVEGEGDNPFQQLVDALQSEGEMNNADLYLHYTPTTPAPHNINCYVEVPTFIGTNCKKATTGFFIKRIVVACAQTLRKGGRCIQLGGFRGRGSRNNRPWACQAGIHLAFSSDCGNSRRRGRRGRG